MRFAMFLIVLGLFFAGCWAAYVKESASENRDLRVNVRELNDVINTQNATIANVKAEHANKQAAQKAALKLIFPQEAEKIENVFNPPAPKADAVVAPAPVPEATK
jgi:hypothetical protein